MANKTLPVTHKQRSDTAVAWAAANPLLALGEIGFDTTNYNFKVGDGITAWNDLEYLIFSTLGSSHIIKNASDVEQPQRTYLKFIGVKITDDSTNDVTIVTIPADAATTTGDASLGSFWRGLPAGRYWNSAFSMTNAPTGYGLAIIEKHDADFSVEYIAQPSGDRYYCNGNSATTTVTWVTPYNDEKAQDAVGALLSTSNTITLNYFDATPSIVASVKMQNSASINLTDDVNGLKAEAIFGTTAGTIAEGNHTHAAYVPLNGGTMTGILVAQNNTSYTTKQVRNIILSNVDAVLGSMADGDIWIKYV